MTKTFYNTDTKRKLKLYAGAFQRLVVQFRYKYGSHTKSHNGKEGEYPYINYRSEQFVGLLLKAFDAFEKIHKKPPKSFLEIGCGPGILTLIAKELFLPFQEYASINSNRPAVNGLERCKEYLDDARWVLRDNSYTASKNNDIEGDALTFDNYGRYDLIYFYMPFYDHKKQKQFTKQVAEQAKGIVFGSTLGVFGSAFCPDPNKHYQDEFIYSAKLGKCVKIKGNE